MYSINLIIIQWNIWVQGNKIIILGLNAQVSHLLSFINREFNISLRGRYTDLSDSDLDDRVREVVEGNYELGAESV